MTKAKKVAEADGTPVVEKDATAVEKDATAVEPNNTVGSPSEFGLTDEEAIKLAEEKAAEDRINAKKAAERERHRMHPSNLGIVPEPSPAAAQPKPQDETYDENPEIPQEVRSQFVGRQVSLLEANLQAREAARANYDYVENIAQQAKEAIIASGGRVERRTRKNLRPVPIPTAERPKQG